LINPTSPKINDHVTGAKIGRADRARLCKEIVLPAPPLIIFIVLA